MTQKTLLIIGGGREQVAAYKIAKDMGLIVIGTDMDPHAPGLNIADHSLICSARDVTKTLDKVCKFTNNHKIDGVMTIANDVPLTVAKVAESLGLPGIPTLSASLATNKILMKDRFLDNNVPTPKYYTCKHFSDLELNMNKLNYPMILKPSDGRGSRGVLYLEPNIDLQWVWNNSIEYSENNILILEEYIEGPQLSVEGLIVDSKYQPIAFADRNYDNLLKTKPYIVEDGGCIPSKYDDSILFEITQLMDNAAKALDIRWGPFKGDIVLTNNGPMIIEIAARLSGNYLATHHIPMAYGVDIVGAMIKLALNIPFPIDYIRPKHKVFLGVRYFFPPPGRIKEIKGIESVRKKTYLEYLDIYIKPGEIQDHITNHTGRAGTIICKSNSYETAINRVESDVRKIKFVVS